MQDVLGVLLLIAGIAWLIDVVLFARRQIPTRTHPRNEQLEGDSPKPEKPRTPPQLRSDWLRLKRRRSD